MNFLSDATNRYRFDLVIDAGVKAGVGIVQATGLRGGVPIAQLKQLEHKGSRMLRQLYEALGQRYVTGGSIDGQDFQLLPADTAAEIAAAPDEPRPARGWSAISSPA